MIKIRYEEVTFHYITSHYDYHISGSCVYNGKIALFKTIDETDYQTMNDNCPCCRAGGTDNWQDCRCTNAPELYCYITELPFAQRLFYRVKPFYDMLWYIKKFGINGIYYFLRWKK